MFIKFVVTNKLDRTLDPLRLFTARCYAECGIGTAESSVRLSVTLRCRDHIGWKSSKIISRLVSLWSWDVLSSQTPTSVDLLQGEHPEILIGISEGYQKSGLQRTNVLISLRLKRRKIEPRLLLRFNRKSHTCFRLMPKSTTSDIQGQWYRKCRKIDKMCPCRWSTVIKLVVIHGWLS